jgi:hypothetical protein
MLLSRHENVGQNRDLKITDRLFENVSQLKYIEVRSKKSKVDLGGN